MERKELEGKLRWTNLQPADSPACEKIVDFESFYDLLSVLVKNQDIESIGMIVKIKPDEVDYGYGVYQCLMKEVNNEYRFSLFQLKKGFHSASDGLIAEIEIPEINSEKKKVEWEDIQPSFQEDYEKIVQTNGFYDLIGFLENNQSIRKVNMAIGLDEDQIFYCEIANIPDAYIVTILKNGIYPLQQSYGEIKK
ncbi:hypothetical protein ACFL1H_06645 [Nanoarchaeota archaeon]